MSNLTGDDSRSFSSGEDEVQQQQQLQQQQKLQQQHFQIDSNGSTSQIEAPPLKRKRNLPGTPDPSAEVIALSPTTLMATNRFICEICNKGFQRDQNLQLHRRGHNLPWKLKQRSSTEIRKRVYICPETSCVHHNPARALGDLTGIKKHFCRKHGEKKWKCDKCAKKYAVQSDWKAHSKTCGTREYKCDCGTIFSRRDSFITHRAFCDALTEENNKAHQGLMPNMDFMSSMPTAMSELNHTDLKNPLNNHPRDLLPMSMAGGMFSNSSAGSLYNDIRNMSSTSSCLQLSSNNTSSFDGLHDSKSNRQIAGSANMSATALLQKAAQMGASASSHINSPMLQKSYNSNMASPDQIPDLRTYGGTNTMPQNNHSYDSMQSQQTDQSQLVGIDGEGFINQFLHNKGPPEMPPQFVDASTSRVDNDMGVFSGLFGGGDQHNEFLKNMEHDNSSSSANMLQGKSSNSGMVLQGNGRHPTGPSRFGGNGGSDVLTVDFLGVGGSRSLSLHEQRNYQHHHEQHEEQEGLEFGHRMQGLHQYE